MTGWLVVLGSALGVFALGLLATSITERRNESQVNAVRFKTELAQWESNNAKWGESFPREYASWKRGEQTGTLTEYGGNKNRDYLSEAPRLVVMWAGYAFAKEYNTPRSHYYAVQDVRESERITVPQNATCWTCKSPDVPRLMARDGVAEFYKKPIDHYKDEVTNSIGCADCHNEKTMALQISRPALKEAFERQGKDISKASHQEMRSLVCAQCHVEYYFKGKTEKYVTFPWDDGMKAEEMEKYYERVGHSDWEHAISGAKMVKMQHPDYELYSQGIHAARGVSCSDCHMPYETEGGVKFTDHHVRSPLMNVDNSCQVCHRWSEDEIKDRVYGIQDKNREMLDRAENALTAFHLEIGETARRGATTEELSAARKAVSLAQMYWDYVAASNGMGFHAPQESARILAKSIDIAQEARIALARLRFEKGLTTALQLPDISTKEKAQAYIKPFVDALKKRQAEQKAKEETEKAKTVSQR